MHYNDKPIEREYLSSFLNTGTDFVDQLFEVIYSNTKLQQKLDENLEISETREEAMDIILKLRILCEFFEKLQSFNFSLVTEVLGNIKEQYSQKETDGHEAIMLTQIQDIRDKIEKDDLETLVDDLQKLYYVIRRE